MTVACRKKIAKNVEFRSTNILTWNSTIKIIDSWTKVRYFIRNHRIVNRTELFFCPGVDSGQLNLNLIFAWMRQYYLSIDYQTSMCIGKYHGKKSS